MADRWRLERAGITNVYQYGEETLRFGGGRLLLRGVNGSGKSTAMNMLLPFLLEADTRRIDAAGEQAGVLRSWMLSGREEQQPVGYLWIEFARGYEHLTCGCGIRANRSTERVNTWWFVTSRRPGIDVALVENRTPLAVDALRAALGSEDVFTSDQRPAYRAEVRRRLYGGQDLEQHLRLLHVVRNPRVGDRVDLDLANYLQDALPQLSEGALDDAAQPLEDLEEHRRNVEDLTRTASALDGLDAVYRNYARTELYLRTGEADGLVEALRTREREEADVRARQAEAIAERDQAAGAIEQLESNTRRLALEIETLKSRDAYQAGAELTHLREHLGSLDRQMTVVAAEVEVRAGRRRDAQSAVDAARSDAEADLTSLRHGLSDLGRLGLEAGLSLRPPDALRVETRARPPDNLEIPTGNPEVEGSRRRLSEVRADAQHRRGDVREVTATLEQVERALGGVRDAERRVADAEEAEGSDREDLARARTTATETIERWRHELHAWLVRLDDHRGAQGLAATESDPLATTDLAGDREKVTSSLLDLAQATIEHHRAISAALAVRHEADETVVSECRERLAELAARVLPDPPSASWQRPDRGRCLSELVDFRSDLDPGDRPGLEAAMEAAGLLSAEVMADGTLALTDGRLVALGGGTVEQPLSILLMAAIPDEPDGPIADAVKGVLDAISTRAEDLAGSAEQTVVTAEGHFRIGLLRGRHLKAEAEHIGVTARRAALERQRAEAKARLVEAEQALVATGAERARRHALVQEAVAMHQALPNARAVSEALLAVDHATGRAEHSLARLRERHRHQQSAEVAHGEAVDTSRRTASSFGLPHDHQGLERVAQAIGETLVACDLLNRQLTTVARSVDQWIRLGSAWDQAVEDEAAGRQRHQDLRREREPVATKLATLERSVGVEYDEIVLAIATRGNDLARASNDLDKARHDHGQALGAVGRLASEVEGATVRCRKAQDDCVSALPHLRQVLAVPGLLAAAVPVEAPTDEAGGEARPMAPSSAARLLPAVDETPDGLGKLTDAIRSLMPKPDRVPVGGDGVRQSLRQRRDSLGAGWDAEDRQPEDSLPLHIEVTGPLGRMPLPDATARAHEQLRTMASLLSAKQDQALRNLLQGLIAREVADKLHAAKELVGLMNRRLDTVTTSQGIGVALRWQRRDDLDPALAGTVALLAKPPDLRTVDEDHALTAALSERIAEARRDEPEAPYRQLVGQVLDYRTWHRMSLILRRPGRADERLTRRTALSEGEKKMVSYLPLFAAVAASCDAMAEAEPAAPRFLLLDDAFAKVSEDNHPKLFGLLVELDLDFIATSERLWGTHATVPELAITEVLRDPDLGVIVLEHSRWDGRRRRQDP